MHIFLIQSERVIDGMTVQHANKRLFFSVRFTLFAIQLVELWSQPMVEGSDSRLVKFY